MSERNTITGPNTSVFYGDKPIRWFVGTVVEKGNDEPRLGRVKVRIEGVHGPDVSNADIPYAQVLIPTTEAQEHLVSVGTQHSNDLLRYLVFF